MSQYFGDMNVFPGGATLVFEVELLQIERKEDL